MKKFTAFAMAALLAAFMAAPAFAYTDVSDNAAVTVVSEKGIMEGYEDGSFKPAEPITRAEFAKVAVLASNAKLGDLVTTELYFEFSDVKADGWYVENIQKVANMGLMKGDAEGTFRPNDTVSEAEVYTVMLRMLGYNLDNDSKKWPDNYLELAESLDAPLNKLKPSAECNRAKVAEIVAWALETSTATDEESQAVAVSDYGVVTAANDTRITVYTMDGELKSLRNSGSNGELPTAGQLVKFEATKAGVLKSLSAADVKTNDLWEAAIKDGKIELNKKTYGFTKDAVVLSMNKAGGVNVVALDKLLSSSYAAGLRSSGYTAPIQYVLSGNSVSCLLISDYAGQSDLHFGFVETVGTNADGTVVQFWGDKSEYLWDASKNDGLEPEEDELYAYVLRSGEVRGYKVATASEEIVNATVTAAKTEVKQAGDKQFVIDEDTVIWEVEYSADGSIRSCELADEVSEDDIVRVRYKLDDDNDGGIEAAYIIIDATSK